MPFVVSCLLFALLPALFAGLFGVACAHHPELWRRLPRDRHLGIVVAVACLVWSAYYAVPMLEGGMARYQPIIKILVPVVAVLAYFYLNFLLARATGGLLMLAATVMLHQAFVVRLPFRPLFSLICYAIALAGMIALAAPWHGRDLLRLATLSNRWRTALTGFSAGIALALAVFAILGLRG